MKRIVLYMVLVGIGLLTSCSGDDDRPPLITINQAPGVPALVFPINNLICTSVDLEFSWNEVIDNEGDSVRYVIDLARDSNFNDIAFTVTTTSTASTFTLEKGVRYYWRASAIDSEDNASTYSPTQSFYTEPEATVNSLPAVPELMSPQQGSRLLATTVSLEWNASDSDDDVLSYDLYFGDTNPPVLFAAGIDVTTMGVSISSGKVYYWRIVARDPHQSATISSVWNFRTE